MIIDFHTHIFPDELAQKMLAVLSEKGGVSYYADATLSGTKEKMKEWGIDKIVALSIATNAKQMRKVNDFAFSINNNMDLFSFGSVFPFAADAADEIDRIKEHGLKGMKFHPEYQQFAVNDERVMYLYEKCVNLGLIMVFHGGKDIGYPNSLNASPKALAEVADAFPNAKFVFAHLGGFDMYDDVLKYLVGKKNVYLDTAFCFEKAPIEISREIVLTHGVDKVLFGSDCPWEASENTLAFVKGLKLKQEQKDAIFFENAKKLLNI